MYIVPEAPNESCVFVYGAGSARKYASLEALFEAWPIDVMRRCFGLSYGPVRDGFQEPPFYKIRTETGETVGLADLELWYEKYREYRAKVRIAKRRYSKRSGRCRGNWRAPKTQNELRQAWAVECDGEPRIKPRRNMANLVTAWDDKPVRPQKSWKWQSKRKTQYRS